jgi:hypothetical protein
MEPRVRHASAVSAATAAVLIGLGLSACAAPAPSTGLGSFDPAVVLVVENRTHSRVAFSLDLIVEACAERAFTQAELDAAMAADQQRIANGQTIDVPADAVHFANHAFARPMGATFPAVIVIAVGGNSMLFQPFDRATLPACEGQAKP